MQKVAENLKQIAQKGCEAVIEPKKDCFAYNTTRKRCEALTWTYCLFEETCKFYKTKEQLAKEEKERKKKYE